ncbi:MAG TPA: NAD(P)-dependent oxidoreductase [Telluria sp.]|nr:NAD(P)-dependent oxidoreductase [Telluria sp.]
MSRPLPPRDLAQCFALVGAPAWESLRGQRVFLTGGTGFVGKWLTAALVHADRELDLGVELVMLSRDPDAFARAEPELAAARPVRLVRGDVRDFAFPDGAFSHVIHAATDVVIQAPPRDIFSVCVDGTRRVLDFAAARGVKDFLLVSSGAVYGRQPPELPALDEDYRGAPDVRQPSAAYGEGKRVAEWLTHVLCGEALCRPRVARCFAFVGPHLPLDKQFAVGNFVRDALAGQDIVIQGDGTPFRSYLYTADLAGWLWAMLLRAPAGAVYNVGGEEALSIAALAERVTRVLGSRGAVRVLKAPGGAPAERYVCDVSRIRRDLDLPEPTPLDEGILRMARWHTTANVIPADGSAPPPARG